MEEDNFNREVLQRNFQRVIADIVGKKRSRVIAQ